MGSAKDVTQQPQTKMADEKRSIRDILKKPFQALFNRKDKRRNKDDAKNKHVDVSERKEVRVVSEEIKVTPITDLLEFNKLTITDGDVDDELENFSYKLIDDTDSRSSRLDSHKSEDSGFSEKIEVESEDEAKDGREQGKEEGRKRKVHTVVISRAPIQNKHNYTAGAHPYSRDVDCRQISQVNKHTFSGGQVIVNDTSRADNSFLNQALELVDTNVTAFNETSQEEQVNYWQMAEEFINEKKCEETGLFDANADVCQVSLSHSMSPVSNFTPKIVEAPIQPDNIISTFDYQTPIQPESDNPIEEFTNANLIGEYDSEIFTKCMLNPEMDKLSVFPTPPRSENVPSPMSDSQSYYQSNSSPGTYTLSPETSSPMYNSDYERYQDIAPLCEYPSTVTERLEADNEVEVNDKKIRNEKTSSATASMTMKQYKDMQKEIANEFSKMECCQTNRKPCKEIFQAHLNKLKVEHRKVLCRNVASLDLGDCFGVLQYILISLANGSADEDLQLALFSLICEKVLALKPEEFVGSFGLELLKLAVLRCPQRPLLTRYLVQCVRRVTRAGGFGRDCVFTEVDALRDNLVIACARGGDAFALPLFELVSADGGDVPLFAARHANADGHTALHVACGAHSAAAPRAHTAHVLLEHARHDLWLPDIKGGETALHLAVNSANCDLKLIMILFRSVDRKQWKKLAHAQNRSSVTPLEYARSASKSSTRQNFPIEVLEFLKKCR